MAERVVTDVPGHARAASLRPRADQGLALRRAEPARRQWLHQQAAAALEEIYANDLDPHLAELAHHLFAADPSEVGAKAVEYARRAGDRAVAQAAYEEAARLYEMALTLVGEDRGPLRVAPGAGRRAGARRGHARVEALAPRRRRPGGRPRPDRAPDASGPRLRRTAGVGGVEGRRPPPGHPGRALAALGDEDSTARVHVLARLAGGPLREINRSPERRHALSEQALAMARRLGDPRRWRGRSPATSPPTTRPSSRPRRSSWPRSWWSIAVAAGDLERAVEGVRASRHGPDRARSAVQSQGRLRRHGGAGR